MGRWKSKKTNKGRRIKRYPEYCCTCGSKIERPKKSNGHFRNTPKVCRRCQTRGVSRNFDWGCSYCMEGNPKTGIFYHKPEYCFSVKYYRKLGGGQSDNKTLKGFK